jgi:hypothetical protein
MRNKIQFSQWSRYCPDCHELIYYSDQYKRNYADTNNSLCSKCKYKKISNSLTGRNLSQNHLSSLKNGWIKRKSNGYIHPMLGKTHSDESIKKMILAKQKYKPFLGKKHTEETKRLMSIRWKENPRDMSKPIKCAADVNRGTKLSKERKDKLIQGLIGHKVSDVTKEKISAKIKGIKRNDETKEKLRIAKIKQLQKQGVSRSYNPVACQFIAEFGCKYGYNFQHAMNGGELTFSGYFVDGYDKEKNIVFEYDEAKHENYNKKMKDIKRIFNLINKINCKILRYSERYKKIYWSYPDKSELFIINE